MNTKTELESILAEAFDKPDVVKCLERAKSIFNERNVNYKDGWLKVGDVMAVIFEDTDISKPSDFVKFQVINMLLAKIIRFVESGMKHQDSADDLIAYSAMLSAITETARRKDNKND